MKHTIIKCERLYDGLSDCIQQNIEILIEDDKIIEVDKHVARPEGSDIIDLSGLTVTPGLIDAHVHLGTGNWKERRHETIYENPVFKGMVVVHNANKALKRGFTTLRYCGNNCDDAYGSIVAKRMINDGYFDGSRLVVAPHYVSTTRSHGDASQLISTNPMVSKFIWEHYPGYGCGADSFRDVVRNQVKFGADFIKVFATGGFSTPSDGPEDECLSDEEMRAIIETAHQLRKKVTSHSYAPPLIWKQIKMGIDGIEHGALIDDVDLLNEIKNKKIDFVPTFSPYDSIIYQDEKQLNSNTYEMKLKLIKYAERLIRSRKMIVASDIDFGYGTDFTAVHNCYESGYEYETMLKSGVNPFKALRATTKVNAKILQMEGKIGAIAPGYFADISAWRRDLLENPKALLDCAFVMKNGTVYDTETVE